MPWSILRIPQDSIFNVGNSSLLTIELLYNLCGDWEVEWNKGAAVDDYGAAESNDDDDLIEISTAETLQ